jgi:hypothetical protein
MMVAAVAGLVSCAQVPVKEQAGVPGQLPAGKIRGKVTLTGLSVPIDGADVRVGNVKGKVGQGGVFSLPEAPSGKQTLVIEKKFQSGQVRRILGMSTLFVGDAPIDLNVSVRDATDIDAYCLDCHPPLKMVTRKDQKYRDIHISGVVAKRALADKTLLDAEGKITCESCHTIHVPGKPVYGVDDIKSGVFCNRCHG